MRRFVCPVARVCASLTLAFFLATAAFAGEPLTNETIIKMVQSGVPTETIIRTIQSAESFRFGTLPGDLSQLEQAKVPEEIIRALAARINWPGTSPLVIAHPPATPQAPAAVPPPSSKSDLQKGIFATQSQDQEDPYLFKGAKEIEFTGSGFLTHASGGHSLNLAGITGGTFLTRSSMIGVGLYTSGVHDAFLTGFYRYFLKTKDPRVFPFAGVGGGSNLAHFSPSPTDATFLGRAELGLRYFPVRHIAVDMAYTLQYLRIEHTSFGQTAGSGVSFGFIHVF